MTSPNEPEKAGPGTPGTGSLEPGQPADRPTAAPVRSSASGEVVPPWQRTQRRKSAGKHAEPAGTPIEPGKPTPAKAAAGTVTPGKGPSGKPSLGNANPGEPASGAHRPNRVISGTAAPAGFTTPNEDLVETRIAARTEAYNSELPDLGPSKPSKAAKTARSSGAPDRSSAPKGIQVARRGGPVRASMQIRRIDPWTTLKASLILSVAVFFVWMIAVAFLYLVLGAMGVWSKLNSNVGDLLNQTSVGGGGDIISASSIFGAATLIGLVNIVLLTALGALGAFIYNLTADLVGGVEVTLADRD